MKQYKEELANIVNEYKDTHGKLNDLEKNIHQLMSEYNSLKNRLEELRKKEKQIIYNIEEETGEKMTSSKILSLL